MKLTIWKAEKYFLDIDTGVESKAYCVNCRLPGSLEFETDVPDTDPIKFGNYLVDDVDHIGPYYVNRETLHVYYEISDITDIIRRIDCISQNF